MINWAFVFIGYRVAILMRHVDVCLHYSFLSPKSSRSTTEKHKSKLGRFTKGTNSYSHLQPCCMSSGQQNDQLTFQSSNQTTLEERGKRFQQQSQASSSQNYCYWLMHTFKYRYIKIVWGRPSSGKAKAASIREKKAWFSTCDDFPGLS